MDEYLTTTVSTCADCGRLLPARVPVRDGAVWFHKHCPQHGESEVLVRSDAREYLALGRFHRSGSIPLEFQTEAKGCPSSCGLCPEHEQHVCMPIIEITDHCNLECPMCLVKNRSSFHLTPGQIDAMIEQLIAAEGSIDVLNLSGGEPTVNPHFREIVEHCAGREEILRTSVSTNGLALLEDPGLAEFLAERGVVVSLQFDGADDQAYKVMRGRPLLAAKLRMIDMLSELDAPMSLTFTVMRGVNDALTGDAVSLLFERDNIVSVMFQPLAYAGTAAGLPRPAARVTVPDVIAGLDACVNQSVSAEDFSPLPCSHPACFSLAFYLKCADGGYLSIKQLMDCGRYLDMIENRGLFGTDTESFDAIKDAVYELWSGPAALTPDSQKALKAVRAIIKAAEEGGYTPVKAFSAAERSVKSIFVHHFMDRDTFDLARARKCCNVYPQRDGRLVPGCVFNCLER